MGADWLTLIMHRDEEDVLRRPNVNLTKAYFEWDPEVSSKR